MRIALLADEHLSALVDLLVHNASTSGLEGAPRHSPFPTGEGPDPDCVAARRRTGWSIAPDRPGWLRSWGALDGERLVGEAELAGARIPAEMHRASMSMGLLPDYRGRGLGRRMAEACIAWARRQGLVWLDLGVFEDNAPAIALYESLGFRRVGRLEDRFRVDGSSITDVQMTLRV